MGMDDRDGAYKSRDQPPRRRPYDGGDLPTRSSSRDPREMDGPRSRSPRREYDAGGDYDRPTRDPRGAPRGGSSGRSERNDYDRRPRPAGPPRSDRRGYDDAGYDNYDRASRSSRGDPSASSQRGDRSMRGGRPPAREEGWGDPRPARAGARGLSAADSNGRMRRPPQPGGRGGLWDDEAQSAGRLNGGNKERDPRARRLAAQEDEEEKGSPAAGIAKAFGAIVLALVLGAGSAYGYFVVSTPKLNVTPSQQAVPTAPATTPSPSPSATKSAFLNPPAPGSSLLVF